MKFLGQAREFLSSLGTETPRKVQHYSVTCASGHRLRGERTLGYQALRCPACGEGVFVLPASPLPEPAAARAATRPASRAPRDFDPVALTDPTSAAIELADPPAAPHQAEIIWEDEVETPREATPTEPPPAEPAESPPARPRRPNPRETAAANPPAPLKKRSTRPKPAPAAPPRTVEIDPRTLEARRRSRQFKLVMGSVVFLVVATAAWRYRRQMREEYPLIAERGKLEGIPALDDGNFDKAYQLLSAAKAAVDALGGAVDDAETIRNAASEAEIFVDLSSRSLEEILDEAGRSSPDQWATHFKNLYRGRSIILDSYIASVPGEGGSTYDLHYRVFPAGEAGDLRAAASGRPERIGRIDLTGFQLFDSPRLKSGDRATFGARLADFRYDAAQDAWIITLEPKSGVYILRTRALLALGWPNAASQPAEPETKP